MIAIIDYQMGNLRSVQKAFEHTGFEAVIAEEASVINKARGIVLPGVGAFGDCYRELKKRNLVAPILEWIHSGRLFLGICLGLQVLLSESEESADTPGLDVIPGVVKRFADRHLKVPHMGWNQVRVPARGNGQTRGEACPLFSGVPDGAYFYFVHSFYVAPDDPAVTAGVTEYGISFVSAIWRGNVFATQFHPEKSQEAGLKVIENFGTLVEEGFA